MQGAHQEAQKLSTTALPRRLLSLTVFPCRSVRSKSGAAWPGEMALCGRETPGRIGRKRTSVSSPATTTTINAKTTMLRFNRNTSPVFDSLGCRQGWLQTLSICSTFRWATRKNVSPGCLQGEAIQEAEIAGEHGEAPQRNQQPEDDEQDAAEDLHCVQMAAEACIEGEKAVHAQRCQNKWHRQTGRINGEQKDAFEDRVLRARQQQDSREDR